MKIRTGLLLLAAALMLSGCGMFGSMLCHPNSRSEARASSSLVSFLYPSGNEPPRENTIPQLNLPLRVGLAFLPSRAGSSPTGLEAAEREKLLDRIRQRFADRKFISEITIVPDYYLSGASGFDSLQGVQRLYNVDMMALVSYDQVTYRDDNSWSLGYLTIVGAYVLKGSRHDVTTLMDLAVVDPQSRSILLRAGGGRCRWRYFLGLRSKKGGRRRRPIAGAAAVLAVHGLRTGFDQCRRLASLLPSISNGTKPLGGGVRTPGQWF